MYTKKDTVRAVIMTADHVIEGDLYILEGSRITDALNSKTKDFFALTDVLVKRIGEDEVLYEASYGAVNRDAIAAILPVEEPGQ
jgi:hypothetical protein